MLLCKQNTLHMPASGGATRVFFKERAANEDFAFSDLSRRCAACLAGRCAGLRTLPHGPNTRPAEYLLSPQFSDVSFPFLAVLVLSAFQFALLRISCKWLLTCAETSFSLAKCLVQSGPLSLLPAGDEARRESLATIHKKNLHSIA
jgi:hypothetical protein